MREGKGSLGAVAGPGCHGYIIFPVVGFKRKRNDTQIVASFSEKAMLIEEIRKPLILLVVF